MADRFENSFIFWTNKGGVGKTTLCFQSLVAYAETHPDEQIFVVDMDPQANLSSTLLTNIALDWNEKHRHAGHRGMTKVLELQKTRLHEQFPKTVLGFFMSTYEMRTSPGQHSGNVKVLEPSELFIKVKDYNESMPSNIKLLCGDVRLRCAESHILQQSMMDGGGPGWPRERLKLANYLQKAAQFRSTGCTKSTLFIDANPSLDVLTEVALLSCKKLVVPLMFDQYSTLALKSIILLLHGIGSDSGPIGDFDSGIFAKKAKEYHNYVSDAGVSLRVPRLHAIIFNKCRVSCDYLLQADAQLCAGQVQALFEIKEIVKTHGVNDLQTVFNFEGKPVPDSASGMAKMFACHMTDMNTIGMISMQCGLPLWLVARHRTAIMGWMNMTHASASPDALPVLRQIIGTKKMIESCYTVGDEEVRMMPVLAALLRGKKQVQKRKIQRIYEDFECDSKTVWGKSDKQLKKAGSE